MTVPARRSVVVYGAAFTLLLFAAAYTYTAAKPTSRRPLLTRKVARRPVADPATTPSPVLHEVTTPDASQP